MDDKPIAKLVDLKIRTREFALRVIRLYSALPKSIVAQTIGRQLLRSGTSVGANYREAIRGRSAADYGAKPNISLTELEETLYWFELLEGAGIFEAKRLEAIRKEASELQAIFVTLIKKAKKRTSP